MESTNFRYHLVLLLSAFFYLRLPNNKWIFRLKLVQKTWKLNPNEADDDNGFHHIGCTERKNTQQMQICRVNVNRKQFYCIRFPFSWVSCIPKRLKPLRSRQQSKYWKCPISLEWWGVKKERGNIFSSDRHLTIQSMCDSVLAMHTINYWRTFSNANRIAEYINFVIPLKVIVCVSTILNILKAILCWLDGLVLCSVVQSK